MAKPVSFSKRKTQARRGERTDFDFGFNTLSKTAKRAYNRKLGKSGHKAGGGS